MINSHTSYLESFIQVDFNFQSQSQIFLELY